MDSFNTFYINICHKNINTNDIISMRLELFTYMIVRIEKKNVIRDHDSKN